MNRTLLFLLPLTCLLVLLVAAATQKNEKTDFDAATELIVMRKIGHRILQYTGDSTSRVMPVTQPSANEFLIPFETNFSFKPDSLVRIIDDIIKEHSLLPDYIVNVKECSKGTVLFGYAMLGSQQTEIVSCGGREQPVLNYCITLKFREEKNTSLPYWISGVGLFLVCGLLFFAWLYKKKKNIAPSENVTETASTPAVTIGSYLFYPEQLLLVIANEKIILTNKEAKLLSIFAEHPNQIVDRTKLQKEVWEDEGVIVGRSLDVFVSRLRKKLEKDEAVQLVTVHGKGYKLEINNKES